MSAAIKRFSGTKMGLSFVSNEQIFSRTVFESGCKIALFFSSFLE